MQFVNTMSRWPQWRPPGSFETPHLSREQCPDYFVGLARYFVVGEMAHPDDCHFGENKGKTEYSLPGDFFICDILLKAPFVSKY